MGKNQSKPKYRRGRKVQKKLPKPDKGLLKAVKGGNTEVVKEEIEKGANVNVSDTELPHDSPLHLSSWKGHIDIVNALIEANADVNSKNSTDETALHLSSRNGHIDIVNALIEANADVNIRNDAWDTALHLSSRNGHIDIVNALIEANADVNIRNEAGDTALHLSLTTGHIDLAKALIKAGADVNIKNVAGDTALHLSSRNGHIDIAKALIEANADVNTKNETKDTALHVASRDGHTDVAKALIEAHADVNIKNRGDDTALHTSSMNGHFDIVTALIATNADVNIRNRNDDTALHLSSRYGHLDIAKALIEANADVNKKNKAVGETALQISSRYGHTGIAKALIEASGDINCKSWLDETALHLSLRYGHIDIAKALIEANADVNIRNADNKTALHLVLSNKNLIDIAVAVIGAQVNIRNEYNQTYLHLAVLEGNTAIVRKLIECKADQNIKDYQGIKPVLLAALYGHTEIIRDLFNGGAKIDVDDPTEISIMHLILMESDPETLKIVVSDEKYCNAPGNYDRTLIHLATRLGCHKHMKCLLAIAGINVNPKDKLGKTPLHCASEIGNTDTITDLLRAGCELHVLDKTKKSVLHVASIYGHCELVKLFISKGLNPYQVDMFKMNCLHYAALYRNEDVVRELLKTTDNSKYSTVDSTGRVPRQYLHDFERSSLLSRLLNGDTCRIEEFSLKKYHSFRPNLSKCPHVSDILEYIYIGSVNAIRGHDMGLFIADVKKEVEAIIRSAIPEGDLVKVIGVGSSFEGTKNGLPDEFDFIIKLFDVCSSSSGPVGYGKMERHEDLVKQLNIVGSFGLWLWQKLMTYWTKCEAERKTTRTDGERQFKMLLPPQRHPDRLTCTTWTWLYSDGIFKDLPVSIDFVPAIEAYISHAKARSTWLMTDDDMGRRECFKVPKIPHKNSLLSANFTVDDANQLGRVSHPTLEVEHLKALDSRIRNVYITAKCLRKPEVCGFKIKTEKGEVKAASEFVTSYRLKSVFLHLVLLFIRSKLSLGKMVLMVYEQLEKCLERDNLPMFFDPEVNILAGSKLSTEESLRVTRMMTKFVRALYERDYSLEIDRDSEKEAEAIEMEIKTERTALARYDEEMLIYEQKTKEWNDKGRPWRGHAQPRVPNEPALLNAYILENLQQAIITKEKSKNASKDELVPKEDRQRKHVIEKSKCGEGRYDNKNIELIDDATSNCMRNCRSGKEERDFASEVKECADEGDRRLDFDMLERQTHAEGMLYEEQVVYNRKIINDWIVKRQMGKPYVPQETIGMIGANGQFNNHNKHP